MVRQKLATTSALSGCLGIGTALSKVLHGFPRLVLFWVHCRTSVLAWPQSGQASSAARTSQWRYTLKKSCPVVRRKLATASALSGYLGIGTAVSKVSHGFPRLVLFLGHCRTFFSVCGYNALCSSEGQGDFRLRRPSSLIGFLVGSLIAEIST
ncbi:hypothetical protein TNCV_3153281 [Trichonephila clavipes]|nr:hypothetical protein TNCV_3153281 [Trichonephila clavipes]